MSTVVFIPSLWLFPNVVAVTCLDTKRTFPTYRIMYFIMSMETRDMRCIHALLGKMHTYNNVSATRSRSSLSLYGECNAWVSKMRGSLESLAKACCPQFTRVFTCVLFSHITIIEEYSETILQRRMFLWQRIIYTTYVNVRLLYIYGRARGRRECIFTLL